MTWPNHPLSLAGVFRAITEVTSKTSGGTVCACVDPRHAINGFKYIKPEIACFFLLTKLSI